MRSARKVNMHQGRSRYHPLLRRLTTPLQLAFIFLERLHPQDKLPPLPCGLLLIKTHLTNLLLVNTTKDGVKPWRQL